jgi:hypothetical protein
MNTHPTLLNSCASAATAAEAKFRIDRIVDLVRSTRIIALDEDAAGIMREVARQPWGDAHFLTLDEGAESVDGASSVLADTSLLDDSSRPTRLTAELEDADSVIMIATRGDGQGMARLIGEAASLRNIMTAGIVFGDQHHVREAVSALRPFARVLLISQDTDDVAEILTALRA